MSRALVTGGAGFIGSHVAEGLLRSGYDVCIVDDWFLRPRRQAKAPAAAAGSDTAAVDPPLMRALYLLLPLLVLAGVYRLLTAERMDFSAVLVAITAISGINPALLPFATRLPSPQRSKRSITSRQPSRQHERLGAGPAQTRSDI